jgi:hypothetical protein
MVIPRDAARNAIIRLTCFAALWLIALGVRNVERRDPDWMLKVLLIAAFAMPAVLLLFLVQRLVRYRIPWLVEFFGMPLVIGGLVYAWIAIRDLIRNLA